MKKCHCTKIRQVTRNRISSMSPDLLKVNWRSQSSVIGSRTELKGKENNLAWLSEK